MNRLIKLARALGFSHPGFRELVLHNKRYVRLSAAARKIKAASDVAEKTGGTWGPGSILGYALGKTIESGVIGGSLTAFSKAAYATATTPADLAVRGALFGLTKTGKLVGKAAIKTGTFAGRSFLSAQRRNFASPEMAARTLFAASAAVSGYLGLRATGGLLNRFIKNRYEDENTDNTMGLSQSLHRAYR